MQTVLQQDQSVAGPAGRDRMPTGQPLRALPLFYFLHIQKTAGTSMRLLFRRMFGAEFTFFTTAAEIKKQLASDNPAYRLDPGFYGRYLMVGGHFPFSHAIVQRNRLRRRCTYVTLWRDPVQRAVSHYDYIRRYPSHYLFQDLSKRTLAQAFVESESFRRVSVNHQLFYTFGTHELAGVEKILAENNFLIATTKQLDAFVDLISAMSGLPRPAEIPHINASGEGDETGLAPAREQADYTEAVEMIRLANAAEERFMQDRLSVPLVTQTLTPVFARSVERS